MAKKSPKWQNFAQSGHPDGKLLALPENVGQGWKRLTVANTLAYLQMAKITAVKWACTIKLITAVIYGFSQ